MNLPKGVGKIPVGANKIGLVRQRADVIGFGSLGGTKFPNGEVHSMIGISSWPMAGSERSFAPRWNTWPVPKSRLNRLRSGRMTILRSGVKTSFQPSPKSTMARAWSCSPTWKKASSNSVDAQREACAAFILSQKHEGRTVLPILYTVLPILYDDGGFSGGSMELPTFKRLIADIEAGEIDIVVVYSSGFPGWLPTSPRPSSRAEGPRNSPPRH
jgi:hypothetical protein